MNFLKSSTVALALLSASSNAFAVPPTAYQSAYNTCTHDLMLQEKGGGIEGFSLKSPEEQAEICITILEKSHPEVTSKIDLKVFKKGIVDGSYRQ